MRARTTTLTIDSYRRQVACPFDQAPGRRPTSGAGFARAHIKRQPVKPKASMLTIGWIDAESSGNPTAQGSAAATTAAQVASAALATGFMSASAVGAARTGQGMKCAEDRGRVVCQYDADGFDHLLQRFGISAKHPTLIHDLKHGFSMARNPFIPPPISTFIPPNHPSATDTPEHRDFVINYLAAEESLGRISAPYPLDIIQQCYGHVRSSPLGVIDKATPAGIPQKYRLITDASHEDGGGVSINSFIDSDEFPTRWHGVEAIAQLVSIVTSLYILRPCLRFPRTHRGWGYPKNITFKGGTMYISLLSSSLPGRDRGPQNSDELFVISGPRGVHIPAVLEPTGAGQGPAKQRRAVRNFKAARWSRRSRAAPSFDHCVNTWKWCSTELMR